MFKQSMTDPLEQAAEIAGQGKRVADPTYMASVDPPEAVAEEAPTEETCSFCHHNIPRAVFYRRPLRGLQAVRWSEYNCDALVAAHRFMREHSLSTGEFLQQHLPQLDAASDIYRASRRPAAYTIAPHPSPPN